jgi:hypothetical protein
MTDWFRPVFSRTKTPISLAPSNCASSFEHEQSSEDGTPRHRPASRASSYIGFRPNTSPPVPPQTPDTFSSIRDPQIGYYKPSVDQMAETLKVVMMSQSSTTPIPIEYNSCVLHVLEAYQDLRADLNMKEAIIKQLEKSHAGDIKCFEELVAQWEGKETAYKADLKKIEVLLSQTEGGMEKVSMARSESVVHGTPNIGKDICRGLGTSKKQRVQSGRGLSS